MKKNIFGFFLIGMLSILNGSAQEAFKVTHYNSLNYTLEDATPNQEDAIAFILSDFQSNLFFIAGSHDVLNTIKTAVNSNFEMGLFSIGDRTTISELLKFIISN